MFRVTPKVAAQRSQAFLVGQMGFRTSRPVVRAPVKARPPRARVTTNSTLKVDNVSMRFDTPLFDATSFQIQPGEKAFLFGANGTGKSTLLKIICGYLEPTTGSVQLTNHGRIAYMPQDILRHIMMDEIETVGEYLTQGHDELQELMDLLIEAPSDDIKKAFNAAGGHHLHRLVAPLNIAFDRTLASLSGGEKRKIALAKLVADKPDLLVLDEPSNHLDQAGRQYVIQLLKQYRKSLLVVSHDRQLVSSVGDLMLEINPQTHQVERFKSSWSDYQSLKKARHQQALKHHQHDVTVFKKVEREIAQRQRRQNAKSTSHKNASFSDKRTLRRLTEDYHELKANIRDKPVSARAANFIFSPQEAMHTGPLLTLNTGQLDLGPFTLDIEQSLTLNAGSRIAITGDNGAGKTTLLSALFDRASASSELIALGKAGKVAYLTQEQEDFDPDETPLEHFSEAFPTIDTQSLASKLIQICALSYEQLHLSFHELSQGQVRKCQIATLILSQANILLLDEPNNHLDVNTLAALETALSEFKGAILFTSHEKPFVNQLATAQWRLTKSQDMRLRLFDVTPGERNTFRL